MTLNTLLQSVPDPWSIIQGSAVTAGAGGEASGEGFEKGYTFFYKNQ